jgi:ABC-type branched-subunit amino acid transport system substrate-binding protein
VTAAVMTAAVVAAGCSSSGGASGTAQSAGPIKVLTFGEVTGMTPVPMTQPQDGVEAAVDAFNAAGGVQGRKVDLITCNTKMVPADEEGCVAKAASEGVVAAIPSEEALDNITTPILEKEGIPIIGANPTTSIAQYSKTSACFVSGSYVLNPQAATYLAGVGATSLSFMSPTGLANVNIAQEGTTAAATEAGATIKTYVNVSPTATNFTSIAAQATGAGEQGTYVAALPPGLFSLIGDVAQAKPGIKIASPAYLLQDPTILSALAKIPAAKGIYANNYTAFPTDTSVPGIRLYQQQMAKVNKADIPYETALVSWLDGWGGMQILKTITSGPINAATITAAMKTAHVSFQGVAPDWTYQYDTIGLGCVNSNAVYEGVYEGGDTITPLNGDKPVTGISQSVIDVYKKAFAPNAQ